jgi:hypothetical protein
VPELTLKYVGVKNDQFPPYQGGIKGGSNLKSIFNLIITSYLSIALSPPIKITPQIKINSDNYFSAILPVNLND